MSIVSIVVLSLAALAHGVDRKRLAETPAPAKTFDIHSWVQGDWYIQARYVACSFSGSKTFTDMRVNEALEGKLVKSFITWRSDPSLCSTSTIRLTSDVIESGVFKQKDAFGDMASGDQIVVEHNHKKGYDINWGCTKRGVDGRCSDASVWVKTRARNPGKVVWECVVKDLKRHWDLSLREMKIVSHKNPC